VGVCVHMMCHMCTCEILSLKSASKEEMSYNVPHMYDCSM